LLLSSTWGSPISEIQTNGGLVGKPHTTDNIDSQLLIY
jgi:hypothetical protein